MSDARLKLNFCKNSSVHECLALERPKDVTGVKSTNTIEKVLRAFCRGAGMDPVEVESLQLGKCNCRSSNSTRSSTLLDSTRTIGNSNLRDGDYVFVRRNQASESEEEEEEEEEEQELLQPLSPNLKKNGPHPPSANSIAEIVRYKAEITKQLGGNSWMFTPFFECHLKDMGYRYWYTVKTAVEHALRMTLPSECSNDGHFPKVLQQHLIEATRKRLRSTNATRLQPWITLADFEGVLKLLKVQTVGSFAGSKRKRSEEESESEDSERETEESEDEEESEDKGKLIRKVESPRRVRRGPGRPRLNSNISPGMQWHIQDHEKKRNRISELWGNTLWKNQKIRDELPPLSLTNGQILKHLVNIAELTSGSYTEFPPSVLSALRRALSTRQSDPEAYQRSVYGSPMGWPQGPVVKDALELVKKETKGKSSQRPPTSSLQVGASSSSSTFAALPPLPSSSDESLLRDFETSTRSFISRSSASRQMKSEAIQYLEKIKSLVES